MDCWPKKTRLKFIARFHPLKGHEGHGGKDIERTISAMHIAQANIIASNIGKANGWRVLSVGRA